MTRRTARAALLLPALLLASCAASRGQGGGEGACPAAGAPAANATLTPAEVARQLPALKAGHLYRYAIGVDFHAGDDRPKGKHEEGNMAATVEAVQDGEAAVTLVLQEKGKPADKPEQVRFPATEPWRVALPPQDLFKASPASITYAGSERVATPSGVACAWRLDFTLDAKSHQSKVKLFVVPGVAVAKALVTMLHDGRPEVDAVFTLLEAPK